MADVKHTPGPLGIYPDCQQHIRMVSPGGHVWTVSHDRTGKDIGHAYAKADASLWAAAPDMLEALKEAAAYIGDRSAGSAEFWRLYEAAIAKAEGKAHG